MQQSDFVPLHLHTEYSLLDGAIRIGELVRAASGFGMPAVAVTDHGNLFGALEFYRQAVKGGLRPVIGCEAYVAPGSRHDRSKSETEESSFHLVLLSKDMTGYKNLVTLVSKAYTEGFYYKPRMDRELLSKHSEGLIALTACMKGEVPFYLRRGDDRKARECAEFYREVFGAENLFIELQDNGLAEQEAVNRKLVSLARELSLGVAATNDCHYLRKEDARAHDILLCIQTGRNVSDRDRMKFDSDGFYFKSPEEIKRAFKDLPEAVLNTRAIAERCSVEFTLGESLLPAYGAPDGGESFVYLKGLALRGLAGRFPEGLPPGYGERLDAELAVIEKMGYASYFLIVWDFINYAKGKNIPVGPGRGSAAGSLVSYALGITEIEPIRYGLLFERFLNPERISMPDIDVDFCKDRRPEVLAYVSEKYGREHVAQIITFGTMAARASIRDVARALEFSYAEADRLAKIVPEDPGITLNEAMRLEPRLKEAGEQEPRVKELLDIALRLEGLARHASTHAAGIVISPRPLTDFTPLYRNPSDETVTTQFDMGSVEKMGLVKFDLLGLKTLTVMAKTLEYIREGGAGLSLEDVPLDDARTYELLSSGHTTGIFQLESAGMRDILTKMRPGRFEELIALVALYRPGPIGSGMIEDFIRAKRGKVAVKYELPQLKDILDETYGVILYQEQVMNIAHRLAGFTMGQADILRKAMGKKRPEEMEKQKEAFIRGAKSGGIPEKKAQRLFELMAKFAEYGFNKSHSAAYALIAYQTAYLKAHYPVEFMAATLSADLDNTDRIVKSINECRNMSIPILPPDINLCGREFKVSGGSIRFGLGAVKGVGAAAIESILEARRTGAYSALEDFAKRVDTKKVNKKVIESLIKAGALDSLGENPGGLKALGRRRAGAMKTLSSPETPSLSLFGQEDKKEDGWDEAELLRHEKEAIGFYITGNPLKKYRKMFKLFNIRSIPALEGAADRTEVATAGMIAGLKKIRTKGKAETMAALTLEDEGGTIEVIVFPDLYNNNRDIIVKDTPCMVKGTLDRTERGLKVVAREISGLDGIVLESGANGKKIEISVEGGTPDFEALKAAAAGSSGPMPLYLRVRAGGMETLIITSLSVKPDRPFIDAIERHFGKGALKLV